MSADQPTVLPWHYDAAREINSRLNTTHYVDLASLIARHDPRADALRLLREADEVLCDVSRYPVASAYPDGPCLERETHDNVCKLLIEIRAHLAAHRQTGGGK